MNSTHGPFFQGGKQLPPLSAMNKFEKSTKESDNRDYMAQSQRRAETKMDIRTQPLQESDAFVSVAAKHQKPLGHDPFYSHDMVKLADEAREQLETVNKNKIDLLTNAQPADETVIDNTSLM